MIQMTAREAFGRAYKGAVNFMTPDVLEYGELPGGRYYELSAGRDFYYEPMYGVTVVEGTPDGEVVPCRDLCRPFVGPGALEEAQRYIQDLGAHAPS